MDPVAGRGLTARTVQPEHGETIADEAIHALLKTLPEQACVPAAFTIGNVQVARPKSGAGQAALLAQPLEGPGVEPDAHDSASGLFLVGGHVDHLVGKGLAEQHTAKLPTLFVGRPEFVLGHVERRQRMRLMR